MRFDVENALTQAVIDYLASVVSDETKTGAPIVGFSDPMTYTDEGDRIVVMVPDADVDFAADGNFSAMVEVGVKTLLQQSKLAVSVNVHFARVNDVRDKLAPSDLDERVQAKAPVGMVLDFIGKKRHFMTSAKTDFWIYSATSFQVQGHFTTQT